MERISNELYKEIGDKLSVLVNKKVNINKKGRINESDYEYFFLELHNLYKEVNYEIINKIIVEFKLKKRNDWQREQRILKAYSDLYARMNTYCLIQKYLNKENLEHEKKTLSSVLEMLKNYKKEHVILKYKNGIEKEHLNVEYKVNISKDFYYYFIKKLTNEDILKYMSDLESLYHNLIVEKEHDLNFKYFVTNHATLIERLNQSVKTSVNKGIKQIELKDTRVDKERNKSILYPYFDLGLKNREIVTELEELNIKISYDTIAKWRGIYNKECLLKKDFDEIINNEDYFESFVKLKLGTTDTRTLNLVFNCYDEYLHGSNQNSKRAYHSLKEVLK